MMNLFTRAELAAYQKLLRPVLFHWAGGNPEVIHEIMISWFGYVPAACSAQVANPVTIAGVEFPNRIGMAAGLDKNGVVATAWARFDFSHAELGTATGQAQPGNLRPRVFRTRAPRGVINRMEFNNRGTDTLADRLLKLGVQRGNCGLGIPSGVSIGKTKVIALVDAASDYLASLDVLRDHANYSAVNVPNPNTPGLRSLQAAKELEQLLGCIVESASQGTGPTPAFVKLAPDLKSNQLTEIVAVIRDCGATGVIVTDTTLSREGLAADDRYLTGEEGGLNGVPLTTRVLAFARQVALVADLPVIGVGGIMSPHDGMRMFEAEAVLLQIYTGFIYTGPVLVRGLNDLLGYA